MVMNESDFPNPGLLLSNHCEVEEESHKTKKPLERQTINNVIADYRPPDLINGHSWDVHNSSSGNDVEQYVRMFVDGRLKQFYSLESWDKK